MMRNLLGWIGCVDASPSQMNKALDAGETLAVAPGGIAEIFWGYPRPGCKPDDEYALIKVGLRLTERRTANHTATAVKGGCRPLPPHHLPTSPPHQHPNTAVLQGAEGLRPDGDAPRPPFGAGVRLR